MCLPLAKETLLAVSDVAAAVTGHAIDWVELSATDPPMVHGA
jgi:hypothetical protein